MGLLDDVMGMAGMGSANAQSPGHTGALAMLLGYINSPQVGGISGLQQLFQQKGLGGIISSWIGTMIESSGAAPFGFKGADGDFFLVLRVSHAQPSSALLRASSSALYYF